MERKPQGVPIDELSKRAKASVEKALSGHAALKIDDFQFGFLPDPGVIGFVIRDEALGRANAADFSNLATTVVSDLGDLTNGAGPVVLLKPPGGTMGYFPV